MIKTYIEQIIKKSKLSSQEAIWLLEHVCQEKYTTLLNKNLTAQQEKLLDTYVDQIANQNKPLSYIIGWVPFLDLKLNIHPPILIPRAETEEWVDQVIEKLSDHQEKIKKILDIGTGSGAIALSLAKSFPQADVIAIDINQEALLLAQENAKINGIRNVTFLKSNLFENLKDQKFDIIVSNPPYIPQGMKDSLSLSVTNWEDQKALFSGELGLDLIEMILNQSSQYLTFNQNLPFQLVLEIDTTQHSLVTQIANNYSWSCSVKQDLFGNWRTAWCSKKQ